MKKILGLIGAMALLAAMLSGTSSGSVEAAPAAVQPSAFAVKAMSYNVLYASAAASGKFPLVPAADLDWDVRDDQVAEWVQHEDPM